jgi:hypothetical protein
LGVYWTVLPGSTTAAPLAGAVAMVTSIALSAAVLGATGLALSMSASLASTVVTTAVTSFVLAVSATGAGAVLAGRKRTTLPARPVGLPAEL